MEGGSLNHFDYNSWNIVDLITNIVQCVTLVVLCDFNFREVPYVMVNGRLICDNI